MVFDVLPVLKHRDSNTLSCRGFARHGGSVLPAIGGLGVWLRFGVPGFVQAEEMIQSPFEDVVGRVQVGVHACMALPAFEVRLAFAVLLGAMPAFTACLRRVRGVDEYETVSSGQPDDQMGAPLARLGVLTGRVRGLPCPSPCRC